MKRLIVIFLTLVLLGLSGCQKVLPDKPIPDEPRKLLEFPGLQWNMSPDAVKGALGLQDVDLIEVPADEVSEKCYQIRVKGEALGELFGEDVVLAAFTYYDYYEGDNQGRYGLGSIGVAYEQDADMEVVREKLTQRYGAESPYKYSFIEPASGWQTSRVYDAAEPTEGTHIAAIHELVSEEPHFYWGSERKEGDYITGDIKATYRDLLKKVNPTADNFDESLDAALQECSAAFIHMMNGVVSEKIKDEDGNPRVFKEVIFNAVTLVQVMQRAGDWTEPIS